MPDPRRYSNRTEKKQLRRQLRASSTIAEAMLWRALQRSQLDGRKFRRQHGIGPFVVDLYCPSERLVVELDGSAHDDPVRAAYDQERQTYIESLGLRVVRFSNDEVMQTPEFVLEGIRRRFRNS
jgi:very-short-patch-repair endonuclease